MPRFEINSKGTRSLVAACDVKEETQTLINITGRVVEDAEHGNDAIGITIGSSDIGTKRANLVDIETDSTGGFGDHGASLYGFINTFNGVILDGQQEARRQLGTRGPSVEEGGGSVSKVFFGHEIVRVDGRLYIIAVDAHSDAHQHMLRTFGGKIVDFQEIGTFEGFETKEIVVEITIVNDGRVESVGVFLNVSQSFFGDHGRVFPCFRMNKVVQVFHDGRKEFFGFLVQIGDCNTRGEDGVIGMFGLEMRRVLERTVK